MTVDTLKTWYDMSWPIVGGILLGALILAGGWLISKWAGRVVRNACVKGKMDEALARFFGNMARYTIIAASVIAALGAVGVQTASLLAVLATAGLAIGLALQGSLANFASGVMLLFFRPIRLGDQVKVAGEIGEVKDLGLFATTLHSANNEVVVIPNAAVTAANITNFTRLGTRRASIPVSIAYGTNLGRAQEVLLRAASSSSHVLPSPAPAIAVTGFAASSLELTVVVWSKAEDFADMQDQVRRSVYEALGREHFAVPFPHSIVEQVAHAHA